MNIITVATPDWVQTELKRFIWLTKKAMPDCHLTVILALKDYSDKGYIRDLRDRLLEHVDQVVPVIIPPMKGRIAFFDWVKAGALEICGLPEALYLDADADIRCDLSELPAISEADFILTPDIAPLEGMEAGLRAYGYEPRHWPTIQCGFMYIRKNVHKELSKIMHGGKIDLDSIGPGSIAWNILFRRLDCYILAPGYQATYSWDVGNVPGCKVLHFTGHSRTIRPYVNYIDNTIVISPEPIEPTITI